ncbi:PIN domain-containing protein [Pelosinus sp. UFO1]|uniref:PIN domain-containing protein n=1 Tax=Pelosinus sp. UFO1 TaxID=484770 RepID=UPI0004D173C7|nr:PIN domain-containing protein [Pelosinus sp. UFO1]AIF51706.1 PilT protein domain protein [Pelosinus sp. UFO1]
MNKILIDTSILISHLNGHQATTDFLRTLAHSDSPLPAISVIGEMELYALTQASPELISKILTTVEVIPLSSSIAQKAGVFKSNFPEMTTEHAIVAATAQEYGFTLVTMDLKAYKIIPGLIVFNIPNE